MEPEANRSRGPLSGQQLGPYQVDRLIGRGGMGEVYLGHDTRLDRAVAIKSMHRRYVEDPDARARFVRETRLASRIVHPYVATVFDVIEPGEEIYLVMEYIEGETLREQMRKGELDRDRATELATEIAEALAAIHREGLVHRDLKPGNIMITREGHAKVMDFGVARRVHTDIDWETAPTETMEQTLTEDGIGVGTVQYMSPEQLRGEPLDATSDLFSLGIVLYESITGEHPFGRPTLMDTVSAILNDSPGGGDEPATLSRSGPLRQIVHNLLRKDREQRYPDAERLAEDLRLVSRGQLPGWRPARTRNVWPRVAAVAIPTVALATALWFFGPGRSPVDPGLAFPVRPVVAVIPFEDQSGERDGTSRGAMVAALLGADLSETRLLRAMETERLTTILGGSGAPGSQRERVDRLVESGAARWIVAASLWKDGQTYQARADVYDAANSAEPLSSFSVAAAGTGTLVDQASVELLALLFPDASELDTATPVTTRVTSESEEARLLYHRGLEAERLLEYNDAIELFERALGADPGFVVARGRLAKVLHSAGYGTRSGVEIASAIRQLEREPETLPERTVLEIRATEARLTGRSADEIVRYRALVDLYPDEPALRLALAGALDRGGRREESLREMQVALELDAAYAGAHVELARLLVELDRGSEAEAALERAERRFAELGSVAGEARVAEIRAYAALRAGDHDRAREQYGVSKERFREAKLELLAAEADRAIGACDLIQGRLAAARDRFEPLLDLFRAAGHYRAVVTTLDRLGAQLYVSGEFEQAEAYLRQALEEARPLENRQLVLSPTINLASLTGYVGNLATSSALAQEGLDIAVADGNVYMEEAALTLLADVDYQQGRLPDALARFDDLLELQRSPAGSGRLLSTTLGNQAEVLEMAGRIGDALEAVENAIEIARADRLTTVLAYWLNRRASLRSHLGLWSEAVADLDEARRIATAEETALPDLLPRLDLTRARLDLRRGRVEEAARALLPAFDRAAASGAVGLEVPLLTTACEIARLQGELDEASRHCAAAVEHKRSMAPERAVARSVLAETFADAGRTIEALALAQRALEDAESYGLPLPGAMAAATLVRLDAPETDTLRRRGQSLLEVYLEGIPASYRNDAKGRTDIAALVATLGAPAGVNAEPPIHR